MISLIFNNLLQNAIKFTPTGGNIEIRSKTEGKHVTIMVIDDGIGMTPEETKGLFRIDVKRSKPGTNDEQGSGLGLILCEEFAEQNEGKISVISKPGEGSQFSVKLPAFRRDRNYRGRLIRE
jgi:signal transduction histidine kinase